jgi:lactate 2-monooxygenase
MLRDTTKRDLRIHLFGETYDSPVLFAPVGVQRIFHEDKETGVAQIAAELNVPFIMSTAASSTIEDVAEASGSGPRWFQLYWPQTDEITISVSPQDNIPSKSLEL